MDGILIDLITQLVQEQPTEGVVELLKLKWQRWRRAKVFPDTSEFISMFKAAVNIFRTVYLVIDSLDLLPDGKVTAAIIDVLRDLPRNVKVLVTSRSGWLTGRELGPWLELVVEPKRTDIQRYVRHRVRNDEVMRRELSGEDGAVFEAFMVDQIISASQGMFLLTKLHMDYVSEQGSLGGVKAALQDLPSNTHTTFDESIRKLVERDGSAKQYLRGLARHVLTWVIHARRPPTTHEVKQSFAVQHSDKELNESYVPVQVDWTSLCAGFVVVDSETETLRLVHESVVVHVLDKGIVPRQYDREMTEICLKYLLLETKSEKHQHQGEKSLFGYAASHWASHFKSSQRTAVGEDGAGHQELCKLARRFLTSGPKLEASFQVLSHPDKSAYKGMTGLHAATYFGLVNIAALLIDENLVDINATCHNGQTALHWAVQYEQLNVVQMLLGHKLIDPNIQDRRRDTPLHLAVVWSVGVSDNTVSMLVAKKARLDMAGSKNQTPLSWVIRYGPLSTARILLDSLSPAAVATSRFEDWSVLRHVMVFSKNEDMINDVLAKGADLNTPDSSGWTPLRHAVMHGDTAMVRRLLNRDPHPADAKLRDPEGYSPLMWALSHDQNDMADLLIDHGASADEVLPDASTPLIRAVRAKNKKMIWKLMHKRAGINHQDSDGQTALHYAVAAGDGSVAWLLVTNGADLGARDKNGRTVLDLAVDDNKLSLAWLLCENGAVIDGAAHDGSTMLHRTAGRGLVDAVRLLLSRGADKEAKDEKGCTPLHHAVLAREFAVARVLLEAGADMDARDGQGMTMLHLAILRRSGRRRTLAFLDERGASLEAMDGEGRTPLMLAAKTAQDAAGVKVVLRLLDMGADVNRTDGRGMSAWDYVEGPEAEEVRRVLEEAGSPGAAGRGTVFDKT